MRRRPGRKKRKHLPVMVRELLEVVDPRPRQTIVDATVGLGGHAAELMKAGAKVIGIDCDASSLDVARVRLEEEEGTFELQLGNFADIATLIPKPVHAVIADLGVSGPQVDDPARGFSYARSGPLDMRMDPGQGESAAEMLDRLSEAELTAAIRDYGDEEDAAPIAKAVMESRPIRTTDALSKIVCRVRGFTPKRAAGAKLHPAARTFQAIRMLVNQEGPNLDRFLSALPDVLRPGGVAAVIAFHSGEDRRVKKAFRDPRYDRFSRRPASPQEDEVRLNPRARSAKLRWARAR